MNRVGLWKEWQVVYTWGQAVDRQEGSLQSWAESRPGDSCQRGQQPGRAGRLQPLSECTVRRDGLKLWGRARGLKL